LSSFAVWSRDDRHINEFVIPFAGIKLFALSIEDLVSFRKGWTEKIGLGFDVPSKIIVIGPNGPNQEKGPVGEAQQALVNQ
jgi:hypothetical protein